MRSCKRAVRSNVSPNRLMINCCVNLAMPYTPAQHEEIVIRSLQYPQSLATKGAYRAQTLEPAPEQQPAGRTDLQLHIAALSNQAL